MFGERVPESLSSIVLKLFSPGSNIVLELHHLHYSSKLVALQEILSEYGIGTNLYFEVTICVWQHRVLIFAQHKVMPWTSQVNLWFPFLYSPGLEPEPWGLVGHNWESPIWKSYEEVRTVLSWFLIFLTFFWIKLHLPIFPFPMNISDFYFQWLWGIFLVYFFRYHVYVLFVVMIRLYVATTYGGDFLLHKQIGYILT